MLEKIDIPSPKRNSNLQTCWEGFFPYYAGFPESFAQAILVGAELSSGSSILDPWNGSGTTTYVASTNGVSSIGLDLNPVMVVVAKARLLARSEADSLEPLGTKILKGSADELLGLEDDPLRLWFSGGTAHAIRQIERSIRRHLVGARTVTPTAVNLNHLSCLAATNYAALFSVCRDLSRRFQSSNPTWLRRPKKGERKIWAERTTIERKFTTKLLSMAKALGNSQRPRNPVVSDIRLADTSRAIPAVGNADLILTSPPYCTRIDYAVATRIELAILQPLLTQTPEHLSRQMTGSTRVPDGAIDAIREWGGTCRGFLAALKRHPSKASAGYYYQTHLDYFKKMYSSLANCAAALRSSGELVLVVQDSFYKDVHNDLPTILAEMTQSHGLDLVRRRDFYIGRSMAGINPGSRTYPRRPGATESVLCFRKQ
jgi:hypothetical protein